MKNRIVALVIGALFITSTAWAEGVSPALPVCKGGAEFDPKTGIPTCSISLPCSLFAVAGCTKDDGGGSGSASAHVTNPQADYKPSGKTDYRLSCPYLKTDPSVDGCKNLHDLPSPLPY